MSGAVAIRVDASPKIGIGHVMRCLTLADSLAARGAQIRFVSRHLPAHLSELVRARGHECHILAAAPAGDLEDLSHAGWLEVPQAADAAHTRRALSDRRWDALIVDHYALDARWEGALRASAARILVIDDIADRLHDCDVLLDQNVYPDMETRYAGKVPSGCELLIGPRYALLRDEFRLWRERAAPRGGAVQRILVGFGGVDAADLTHTTLEALRRVGSNGWNVDVVVGAAHPRLAATVAACDAAGYACHVQSNRMAELMAAADLALGAAGSTSWERCSVGLPTICVPTAQNQVAIAAGLTSRGVAVTIDAEHPDPEDIAGTITALLGNPEAVASMSRAAWNLVDALGADRVRDRLLNVT